MRSHTVGTASLVDGLRFEADPDLDPTFHFDADPDPDWHQNNAGTHADPTPSIPLVGKYVKNVFTFKFYSQHCQFTKFFFSQKWHRVMLLNILGTQHVEISIKM
jgi:hypothetical protein